ncbi:MAG: HAMP domain-containing protein [Spirochaetes bacterium]|nr:HAMP domain-containing protein [Spirochaetota bacterium]
MASSKQQPLHKRLLNVIFKQNREIGDLVNVREVYFGLRSRVLGLLALVMIVVVSILAVVMYFNNRRLVESEKSAKARSLTHILTGPAEFYLDKTNKTTAEELQTKYQIIQRESQNFLTYNDDIVKIILTDESGRTRFSTSPWDYRRRDVPPYIRGGLLQKEEKLVSTDYTEQVKEPKKKKTRAASYRALTYPILLHKGETVNILQDFNRFYGEYHGAGKGRKSRIYFYLWSRHRDLLGKDFDPAAASRDKGKPKGRTEAPRVSKVYDVDFLFLALFNHCMTSRNRRILPRERWLWNDRWLFALKEDKMKAYRDDASARAKEIDDLIQSRIRGLAARVEESRRLGVLAVVFNVDSFRKVPTGNIELIMKIALVMIAVGCAAVLVVLNFSVRNLKKLEKWAISVSRGNLDEKIEIASNDEIGRLGDITNYMIDEIRAKYHLEKFVSRSTRSMISGSMTAENGPDLGVTGRKTLAFIFSDVRGFTSFSEKNDPETVIEVLNYYLELQSNIIKGNKGDIDDFVGDQIMAHFSGETRADRAIDTAIKIMKSVAGTNAERAGAGLPVFEVGIGVHEGDVVTGNIGSKFRMDFACVGDAVNLTSRLCSAAGAGEIFVSQDLFDRAKKKYAVAGRPSIEVKGKEKRVKIVKIDY